MLPQYLEIHRLTAKLLRAITGKTRILPISFTITIAITTSYAKPLPPTSSAPSLTSQEISYVNALPVNSTQIPAWLIAQLLSSQTRLRQFSTSHPTGQVSLNELLANLDRYRSKVIAIKAVFVEAIDVKKQLQLLPPDRCWSVILLDEKYHQPLQLFTSHDPAKFQKHPDVWVFGYYLTNRIDRSKSALMPKPLIIPVLTGIILPMDTGPTTKNKSPRSNVLVNVLPLLATIVLLLVAFFALKYYIFISKSGSKSKATFALKLSELRRGQENAKSETKSDG
jgi:hypothetical protein